MSRRNSSLLRIYWIEEYLIYIYIYIYIYQPLKTSRMRCQVNFKRSLIGSNSKLSLSWTDCHTKVKEPVCSITSKGYLDICLGFELGSLFPVPTNVTITPRAPSHSLSLSLSIYIYIYIYNFYDKYIYIYIYIYIS